MQLSPKANPSKNFKFLSSALDLSHGKVQSEPAGHHRTLLSESSLQEEELISPTKGKELPLKDLIVFVEIHSNDNNISEASYQYLENLGAKIEKRMNKKCNLVIWKDGSLKTVERAKEYGVPVVNSLWLEECIETHTKPDFEKYAPILPDQGEFPFLSTQDRKKRKAQEPLNQNPDEEINFDSIMSSSKNNLKKRKTGAEKMSRLEEKITVKLDSITNKFKSEDRGAKTFRRSQTAATPSMGSWLLDFQDKGKKKIEEEEDESDGEARKKTRNNNKDRYISSFDKNEQDKIKENNLETTNNIELIKKKREEEEHSARMKTLLSKYTKSGSFGSFEEENTSSKYGQSWNEKKSEKSSDESEDNKYRPRKKMSFMDDDDDNDDDHKTSSNSLKDRLSFSHRSYSMGDQVSFPKADNEPKTYSLTTRLLLKQEEKEYNERKAKEKEDQAGKDVSYGKTTLDIGVVARSEMLRIEQIKPDLGKISAIWSKYTGKSDPKEEKKVEEEVRREKESVTMQEEKEEKTKENPKNSIKEPTIQRKSTRTDDNNKKNKIEEEEKVENSSERRISTRRSLSKKESSLMEEEEFSDEEEKVKRNTKEKNEKDKKNKVEESASKNSITRAQSKGSLGKEVDNIKTPQKPTNQEKESGKSTAAKSAKSTSGVSGSSSLNQTPETKQPSWLQSTVLGRYLDSSSSKTSKTTEESNQTASGKSSLQKEQATAERKVPERETRSKQKGKEADDISRILEEFNSEEEDDSEKIQIKKKKKTLNEETKPKEEEKIIKKKTNDLDKKDELIFFSGLSEEGKTKAKKFCEKFGLKYLEDEIRNLERAKMLVYEGNEPPKNFRTAFTMTRGIPVISKAWLEESLKKEKLENKKQYQFSYEAAPRKKLFNDMRFYVDKEFEGLSGNVLQKKDLVSLVEACGAKVLDSVRACDFSVIKKGGKPSVEVPPHVKAITPQWIIDSVIEGKCLNTQNVNYSAK